MTSHNTEIESPSLIYLIIVSLAIHTIFIFLFNLPQLTLSAPDYKDIELKIEDEDSTTHVVKDDRRRIIVPESATEEAKEYVQTPFLASKNTVVKEEQLKRGDSLDAQRPRNKVPKNSAQNDEQRRRVTTREKAAPISEQKNLNEILKKIETATIQRSPSTTAPSKNEVDQTPELQKPSAGDLEARLNAFAGVAGNPDVLDNIRDGEVTLLNAKADRFAVFVRRVALQVFNIMRTSNWYEVGDLANGFNTGEVTIRAVLDKTGRYVSHELVSSSGTQVFDKIISQAVRKGAWDKNPPPSALTPDGDIKFIFKSKAYVRGSPQGRSRQWIQLGTGLE